MKIAILGATSQIAQNLIKSMGEDGRHQLWLYARRPVELQKQWSNSSVEFIIHVGDYTSFEKNSGLDAIINFVGVGDPAAAAQMGADIFDVTLRFDQFALAHIRAHPNCRYISLSSGAAYGSSFHKPVNQDSCAVVPLNVFTSQDWYGAAKLNVECQHRAYRDLPIIDIRIFNYFSSSQNLDAKFLICDILRSIRDQTLLKTSPENIVRDYLHPTDFSRLVDALLDSSPVNDVVDAYSRAPIDKYALLVRMKEQFGLKYEFDDGAIGLNATGAKVNYYSLNTRASQYGYQPKLTSMEGIAMEAAVALNAFIS